MLTFSMHVIFKSETGGTYGNNPLSCIYTFIHHKRTTNGGYSR